jgi:hypothetical protein
VALLLGLTGHQALLPCCLTQLLLLPVCVTHHQGQAAALHPAVVQGRHCLAGLLNRPHAHQGTRAHGRAAIAAGAAMALLHATPCLGGSWCMQHADGQDFAMGSKHGLYLLLGALHWEVLDIQVVAGWCRQLL